ncbi:hypothetical protein [Bacillus sp. EAC]|uniref:hypothetical protein n=1 Tax=Bacillus sp. EAC TaxID=1978338 RepID=UPI000B4439B2|nr:hypothetical protein [Bacillus sp. EAC]
MKKIKQICLLTITALVLSGCTIKKPPQDILINTDGGFDANHIAIKVDSSLPKDAKFEFIIKDDDHKKTIYHSTFTTDEEGSFDKQFTADIENKNVTGYLLFKPEEQPKNIQEKYGENGQNIRSITPGLTKKNDGKYFYIKLYGTFWKYDLRNSGFLYFASKKVKQEKEGSLHN